MSVSGNVAAGLPNRGKTYHGGTPASIGRSIDLEGTEVTFKDEVEQTGTAPALKRSGRTVLCRLVRNSSGISLLPKRAVSWESGYRGTRVDGYTTTTNAECAGIVDDALASSGVADDDLFWIVRKGPCLCMNDIASGQPTNIAVDTVVGALTAATSGATTAGRVQRVTMSATTNTGDSIHNAIGKAMTARTTANTAADLLVDLDLIN